MTGHAGADPRRPGRIVVVHLIGTLGVGGAERQILEQIRQLAPDRFEQHLALFRREGGFLGELDTTTCDVSEVFRRQEFKATDFVTGGNHSFCTTRMHGDPGQGVVDELGRCHDIENLYIADTGIFPQCPSVNPMWTGMALARRTAHGIAERH